MDIFFIFKTMLKTKYILKGGNIDEIVTKIKSQFSFLSEESFNLLKSIRYIIVSLDEYLNKKSMSENNYKCIYKFLNNFDMDKIVKNISKYGKCINMFSEFFYLLSNNNLYLYKFSDMYDCIFDNKNCPLEDKIFSATYNIFNKLISDDNKNLLKNISGYIKLTNEEKYLMNLQNELDYKDYLLYTIHNLTELSSDALDRNYTNIATYTKIGIINLFIILFQTLYIVNSYIHYVYIKYNTKDIKKYIHTFYSIMFNKEENISYILKILKESILPYRSNK